MKSIIDTCLRFFCHDQMEKYLKIQQIGPGKFMIFRVRFLFENREKFFV